MAKSESAGNSASADKPDAAAPAAVQPADRTGRRQPLPGTPEVRPGDPADGGRGQAGDPAVRGRGQGERQGFERQRLDPQDTPPADIRDDQNIAGEKDFELKPPGG